MESEVYSGTLRFNDGVLIKARLELQGGKIQFFMNFDWPPNNRRYDAEASAELVDGRYLTSRFHCKDEALQEDAWEFSSFSFDLERNGDSLSVDGQMQEKGRVYRFLGELDLIT